MEIKQFGCKQNLNYMSHFITLEKAKQMTSLYRKEKENVLKPEHKDKNILPIAETFDRVAFDTLLAKKGCTSIRLYYGMDETFKLHAIIVGANEQGQDMIAVSAASGNTLDGGGDEIVEDGRRCPDECPTVSPLFP